MPGGRRLRYQISGLDFVPPGSGLKINRVIAENVSLGIGSVVLLNLRLLLHIESLALFRHQRRGQR